MKLTIHMNFKIQRIYHKEQLKLNKELIFLDYFMHNK